MSRIDKLSISGVRSFSPSHKEAIQFNTPLTLIVGYNGSGKTTIIECLKYVTTGELPPNSKGGAFVNDPKIAGESEVMAQVKLSFRSANGIPHVVTRSMQLTAQRVKRVFKTLEGSLAMTANGERSQVSLRNVKLDELVPHTLGVSPAVLDSVIFCHQDESLWPLSEPALLKKRFDEIFQAAKWTKAIDALKTLRKRHGDDLQNLRQSEEQERVNKEKSDRCEKKSHQLQDEIEAARAKCKAMTKEMAQVQEQARKKHEQTNSFLRIAQDLKNKKDQLKFRQDDVGELKKTLTQLREDDDGLNAALERYEGDMARYHDEAEQNKTRYSEMRQGLAQSRLDLSAKHAELGRHQSDKDKYERQIGVRRELIREAARKHEIRGHDGDLDDAKVKAFADQIQKLLAEKGRGLQRLQDEQARELEKATGSITGLESRKATRNRERVLARQRSGAIDKSIAALQGEVGKLDVDDGAEALIYHEFGEVTERLQRARTEFDSAGWDGRIQDENDQLWQLESQNDKLNQELVECTRLATERAQLDFRKKELADKRRKLDAVASTWNDKLTAALGSGWNPDTLEAHHQSALKQQRRDAAEAGKKREQVRSDHQRIEFRLKNARQAIQSKTDEAASCSGAVTGALKDVDAPVAHVDDYPDEVRAAENEVETLKSDLGLFDALREYYDTCKKYLLKNSRCALCDRAFEAAEVASRARLEKKIEKHLDHRKKEEVQNDLRESSARLEKLAGVRSRFETRQRLVEEELPRLREECRALEAEFEARERQLEEEEGAAAAAEGSLKDLESMGRTVMSIVQTAKDVKDAESQIDRVVSQQQSSGVGARGADEIHEMQAKCTEQIRALKTRLAKLTTDRQRTKDRLTALELEKSELANRMNNAARQLERKKDLQKQIQALRDEQATLRDDILRADKELEAVDGQLAEERSLRDDVLRRCRAKEQAAAEERDAVADSVGELKPLEAEIQAYIDRGGPSNLASHTREIRALEKAFADAEADLASLTVRANQLKQEMDNSDRTKRNIQDNLKYRKNLSLLAELERDIGELESRSAHESYDRLAREAAALDDEHSVLLAKRASLMGEMKSKDEELGRLLQEWEQDFKHAGRRWRESHVRVEATKAAIQDLGQYTNALDKAIMQYHSLKMEEINRIAGELWQSTYQGTDIDTILIRSDSESAASARRSYNYRLCMVKQDTEMDMRGRCSAGQKVLASIIVRLALAESFGSSCGLVALDEPTTNLDSDNIKSLAESLHAIIRARQSQANLQLIVITHDEEFLRHMRCNEFCDGFYRVRRDDRQNSVIEKQSISKVI